MRLGLGRKPGGLSGGAVNGNCMIGDWPGLKILLDDRSQCATTDLRTVFRGIAADQLGVGMKTLNEKVFIDSTDVVPLTGLIKA